MRPGGGHLAQVDLGLGYEYIRTLGTGAFGSVLQYRRHTAQGPEVSRALWVGQPCPLVGSLLSIRSGYRVKSVLRSCRSLPKPHVAVRCIEALVLMQDVAVKLIARDECADFNLVSREVHSHRQLIHRKSCSCRKHAWLYVSQCTKGPSERFPDSAPPSGANSTRHPLQAPRVNARQAAFVHGKPRMGLPSSLRKSNLSAQGNCADRGTTFCAFPR